MMGKAARLARQERERNKTAEFGVFCPGMLDVLSIGHGDVKLTLDTSDPKDVEDARQLIEEMLRKGYSIFVDTDDGPTKVREFNPKRMTYVVADVPGNELAAAPEQKALPPGPTSTKPGRKRTREVPVAGSRSTAVGRSAGG
jgi:hypothetical protein